MLTCRGAVGPSYDVLFCKAAVLVDMVEVGEVVYGVARKGAPKWEARQRMDGNL